eukprot:CAMPEP_0197442284 /NCGR_PEP_ID=MMETSP1175-20131217/8335_1 /TAXON_ID=1003142 /ORGANISM="Triceratium dubium, Strain CCMP147" /LENGTH=95 /DNA_ID=CAMNT_0042972723 /DNA_START=362 /DNA_END=646 /DNA_ORIENTATION=+
MGTMILFLVLIILPKIKRILQPLLPWLRGEMALRPAGEVVVTKVESLWYHHLVPHLKKKREGTWNCLPMSVGEKVDGRSDSDSKKKEENKRKQHL